MCTRYESNVADAVKGVLVFMATGLTLYPSGKR